MRIKQQGLPDGRQSPAYERTVRSRQSIIAHYPLLAAVLGVLTATGDQPRPLSETIADTVRWFGW